MDIKENEKIISHLLSLVNKNEYYITQHAHAEMYEEEYSIEDVIYGIRNGEIIEHYPEHKRGPCCLINGKTNKDRPIHVVTTTMQKSLVI